MQNCYMSGPHVGHTCSDLGKPSVCYMGTLCGSFPFNCVSADLSLSTGYEPGECLVIIRTIRPIDEVFAPPGLHQSDPLETLSALWQNSDPMLDNDRAPAILLTPPVISNQVIKKEEKRNEFEAASGQPINKYDVAQVVLDAPYVLFLEYPRDSHIRSIRLGPVRLSVLEVFGGGGWEELTDRPLIGSIVARIGLRLVQMGLDALTLCASLYGHSKELSALLQNKPWAVRRGLRTKTIRWQRTEHLGRHMMGCGLRRQDPQL
ncbi:hypothetical protein K470DRAFT_296998 [Piedraia hortae CBS 480.64]|uniref:Uncharacterized protein n=1 Tax=Piedraia hortae CBS 480.64 TaxID=1314780 RepID=A0A6A7BSU9_9PEZI|nr:hypothetical protein K470DRAFT_296998 [Piedraia hortae CBS 480.64]